MTEEVCPVDAVLGAKKKLTNAEVMDYVNWCFSEDVIDRIANLVPQKPVSRMVRRIKEMYFEDTGIEISDSFIRSQKGRWVKINGEIVKAKNS